jgi:hypothetical protein
MRFWEEFLEGLAGPGLMLLGFILKPSGWLRHRFRRGGFLIGRFATDSPC